MTLIFIVFAILTVQLGYLSYPSFKDATTLEQKFEFYFICLLFSISIGAIMYHLMKRYESLFEF